MPEARLQRTREAYLDPRTIARRIADRLARLIPRDVLRVFWSAPIQPSTHWYMDPDPALVARLQREREQ